MHRFNLKKRSVILLIYLLCIVSQGMAQGKYNGKVVSNDGDPVPFASVWLEDSQGVIADSDGNFTLIKIPKEGKLKISAVGFETLWTIWPEGKRQHVFTLHDSESELEAFVVTGNFDPESARNSVYQVRSIDQQVIQNRAPSNIQQALTTELGIRFSQDNSTGGSNLELLGMSGQNIKILIDGVPMVGRQGVSNEININQIDVNQIQKIEIVEGPMSVVYGADALAGVINIITKIPSSQKFSIQAKVQEETVGSEYSPFAGKGTHIRSVSGNYGFENWNFGASFSQNNFGGWQGEKIGREKEWLPKDQNFLNLKVGYLKEGYSINYHVDFLNENVFSNGPTARLELIDQEYLTNRWMHRLSGQWDVSKKFAFNWQGAYTNYTRGTATWITNVRTNERYLSKAPNSQSTLDFNAYSWRVLGQWKINSNFKLQPGIDLNIEKGRGERINENKGIQDYAAFLSAEWSPSESVQIKPGLRKAYNSAYQAPAIIPSINTKFNLNKYLSMRFAYARGFRAPSIRELYFNFFDASHSVKGNPDLKAETSHSINASLDWKKELSDDWRIGAILGGFYNNVDDRIAYGQDPNDIQLTTLINVENYKTAGFTFTYSHTYKNFSGNIGYSYIGRYNQLTENKEDIPTMSWTPELNTNLTYTYAPWNTAFTLYYKMTGALPGYEAITDLEGNSVAKEIQLDGYQWMDLAVRKQFKHGISVNLGARNLFNVKQINSTTSGSADHSGGASQPIGYGRSYFLGIQYQFNQ